MVLVKSAYTAIFLGLGELSELDCLDYFDKGGYLHSSLPNQSFCSSGLISVFSSVFMICPYNGSSSSSTIIFCTHASSKYHVVVNF